MQIIDQFLEDKKKTYSNATYLNKVTKTNYGSGIYSFFFFVSTEGIFMSDLVNTQILSLGLKQ